MHPYWMVGIVLLMCLGCPAYIVYTKWADPRAEAGMTAAATSYLDALRDGDPAAAYQWVCGREQKKFPLSRWLSTREFPDIESYRIIDAKVDRGGRGGPDYDVEAEIHYADGRVERRLYDMSDETGWRVCYETAIGP